MYFYSNINILDKFIINILKYNYSLYSLYLLYIYPKINLFKKIQISLFFNFFIEFLHFYSLGFIHFL